jgi:hypothetical protein
MAYKALTYVNLPPDNRKVPGDTITERELKDAGQTEDDIKTLVKAKAIGNMGAELDEAHAPVEIPGVEGGINVVTGEVGTTKEETK